MIGLKRSRQLLSQSNTKPRLGHVRFPALGTGYVFLFQILIDSSRCLRFLSLVIVIALVLALRDSNEICTRDKM